MWMGQSASVLPGRRVKVERSMEAVPRNLEGPTDWLSMMARSRDVPTTLSSICGRGGDGGVRRDTCAREKGDRKTQNED